MSKKEDKMKCFYYRQTYKGQNYCTKDYWCPGDPILDEDMELLQEVIQFYQQQGYAPCRADLSNERVTLLKSRFRTWKNVILAAGLPAWNSAECQKLRQEAIRKADVSNK